MTVEGPPAMQPRVAVVTGAARGIGLAITSSLAATGYAVVMVDLDAKVGAREAARLAAQPHMDAPPRFVDVDLGDSAKRAELVQLLLGLPRVDVLVNNAAVYQRGHLAGWSRGDYEHVQDVNVTSAFL